MSIRLGICPEEPREPFQPYTSMHTKHNHINVSLPPPQHTNKQESLHSFQCATKNNHFDKCQREKERTAAGHKDTGGNIQFTEPDTQPWILTSVISLSMTSFHVNTVNKSLILSRLLCSPVL